MILKVERQEEWVKLILLIVSLAAFLLVPLKISSLGYFPGDDALRHVAHVVDGRTWSDVLVLNPAIPADMDSHPGWHALLRFFYERFGLTPDELVASSYILTFVVFAWAGAFASGTPLSWLAACVVLLVAQPDFLSRLLFGRPYIITTTALVILLFYWSRRPQAPNWRELLLVALILGISNWFHPSAWYVWLVIVAAFFMTGNWRRGIVFGASLILGLLIAALLERSFSQIVVYPLVHLWSALFQDPLVSTSLVTEFQPSGAPVLACLIAAGVLTVKVYGQGGKGLSDEFKQIDFVIFLIMWLLGLKIMRFWTDWGVPAYAVWLTRQFALLANMRIVRYRDSLAISGFLAATLYLGVTANISGRYTWLLNSSILTKPTAELEKIQPDKGGVLYSTEMSHFYRLYYRLPHAEFKYVLGFESGMMAPDDLRTLREIQLAQGDFMTYKPWFEKMTPKDRVILYYPGQPVWKGMKFERFYEAWVGRKESVPPPAKTKDAES